MSEDDNAPEMPEIKNLRSMIGWASHWPTRGLLHIVIRELSHYVFALEKRIKILEAEAVNTVENDDR